MKKIIIRGARQHNLKNIDLELPRDSFIVVSGLSGSGKSSLAFDTIYAEGQRRYVESLSSYARQFLGRLDKPDLDYIEGLSPAISIEQKTTHRNPRSTVGTVTEIYDYLRLFFAKIGMAHCPTCGRVVEEQGVDQILDTILSYPNNTRLMVLSPIIRNRKGEYKKIFEDARRSGFVRVRVDGQVLTLEDEIELDKRRKHSIEIVVDRLKVSDTIRQRLADSVETALEMSEGDTIIVRMAPEGEQEEIFSKAASCPSCGFSMPELSPQLFSFNAPAGACPSCSGLGMTMEFDPDLIVPEKKLSFNEGMIKTFRPSSRWARAVIGGLGGHFGFDLDTPFDDISPKGQQAILYGLDKTVESTYTNSRGDTRDFSFQFRGVVNILMERYERSSAQLWYHQFMTQAPCHACEGTRLRPEALAVTVGERSIIEVTHLSVKEAGRFFETLTLSDTQAEICREILKEVKARLSFMVNVGLEYLTLDRKAASLSGGEAQRIRLATQIGSSLVGVLYILDEPTIGLHQRDNQRLLDTLTHLRDIGNTLIVVEHDEQTLKSADYIVDLGPGAGVHGGHVVAAGTYAEILKHAKSLTGRYLSGRLKIENRTERRQGNGTAITVHGAMEHNLKNIDVSFPLGKLTVITGVSGSGKSTLLSDILYPALANRVNRARMTPGKCREITGYEYIDKVISIDQSPIGRTPRSNPATYVGLFSPVRQLFASLPEAKARGYKPGRFSFNVTGGRCENCNGDGTIKIEMHFLSDVYITCDVCKGKRYNRETLEIRYKGKNIYEVLKMTVEEGYKFFEKIPVVARKLKTLNDVGMGYIGLGQSALTLSGGEAQRVKLSLELSKVSTGKTFYILDEPTTGLHFADVKKLLEVLQMLADKGNTVVLIEHNLDVIKQADYIIDLGPEGGDRGGTIVASGTPEEIARHKKSYTGQYLRKVI